MKFKIVNKFKRMLLVCENYISKLLLVKKRLCFQGWECFWKGEVGDFCQEELEIFWNLGDFISIIDLGRDRIIEIWFLYFFKCRISIYGI